MKRMRSIAAAVLVLVPAAWGQSGFPYKDESLHYSVNWQSGLSLGDANLTARKVAAGWEFNVSGSVGIPGFSIDDRFHSTTDAAFCSQELVRGLNHAGRQTEEKTTFDQKMQTAERTTTMPAGGGKTDFDIPSCARDALAFAYFARTELGQGRMPPAQQVYLGAAYTVKMDYTGAQNVTIAGKSTVTDHVLVSVKGPRSDFTFDVLYGRDPARTPLTIRLPLAMGTFTLELVR
jgi:hypothetical protein